MWRSVLVHSFVISAFYMSVLVLLFFPGQSAQQQQQQQQRLYFGLAKHYEFSTLYYKPNKT